jgi:hypothetical protein
MIEVKPVFDQHNMERDVRSTLKWVYDKMKLFVQIVKPELLFPGTFMPTEYSLTKTGKTRSLSFTPKTLEAYVRSYNSAPVALKRRATSGTKTPAKKCSTCSKKK